MFFFSSSRRSAPLVLVTSWRHQLRPLVALGVVPEFFLASEFIYTGIGLASAHTHRLQLRRARGPPAEGGRSCGSPCPTSPPIKQASYARARPRPRAQRPAPRERGPGRLSCRLGALPHARRESRLRARLWEAGIPGALASPQAWGTCPTPRRLQQAPLARLWDAGRPPRRDPAGSRGPCPARHGSLAARAGSRGPPRPRAQHRSARAARRPGMGD